MFKVLNEQINLEYGIKDAGTSAMFFLSWCWASFSFPSFLFFFKHTWSHHNTMVHSGLFTGSSCWEMTDRWSRNPGRRKDTDRPWLYSGEALGQTQFPIHLWNCFHRAPLRLSWGGNKGSPVKVEKCQYLQLCSSYTNAKMNTKTFQIPLKLYYLQRFQPKLALKWEIETVAKEEGGRFTTSSQE